VKFLAVDVPSVFRRHWEASGGKDFNEARIRTVRTVHREALAFEADRIVLAFDKNPSFRTVFLPTYKAGRVDPGEGFRAQLKETALELKAAGATIWVSPSLGTNGDGQEVFGEADDVLASFALWYQERRQPDWALRVMSHDHDLYALVDDEIAVDIMNLDGKRITVAEVSDRFSVVPYLVAEIKALCGDKSDNYKPFEHPEKDANGRPRPGIGPETAKDILLSCAERAEGDRSAADAVLRAVLANEDPGCKLTAPAVACLKYHGPGALDLGRKLAYLQPLLVTKEDGTKDTLDFSPVLTAPRVVRPAPPPTKEPAELTVSQAPAAPTVAHESAAIVVRGHDATVLTPYALEPSTMQDAFWLANQAHESGLYRKRLPSAQACMMVIVDARTLGVPAAVALRHAHFVQGQIGWSAMFIMGLVKRSPLCEKLYFKISECDNKRSTLVFKRRGEPEDVKVFSIQTAIDAGWISRARGEKGDGPWITRPEIMLCWANGRETSRRVWYDIVGGMYGPDELARGSIDDGGDLPSDMVEA
jgi:5'-3' exonuclease